MIQKKPAVEFHSGLFPQYSLLLGLDLAKCVAVIGQTILAHPVRQPERPALGAGVSSFQWELRRLSRRALDTFLLGTAMGDTSFGLRAVRHFDYSLSFAIQQLRKGRQSWIYFRSAPAGTEIQVSPAFGTQPFAVV